MEFVSYTDQVYNRTAIVQPAARPTTARGTIGEGREVDENKRRVPRRPPSRPR